MKEGYEPIILTIYADEKSTLFEYDLKEIEDVPLQITSEPTGAIVYIDGVRFGTTPFTNFYPSGRYPIKIEKEWCVTYEDFIDIKSPLTNQNYQLREDFGSVTITSSPQNGLEIY